MSQAFRDALALHRLARMKQRSVRMQVMAKAQAGRRACDCAKCRGLGDPLGAIFRLLGEEVELVDTAHDATKAH